MDAGALTVLGALVVVSALAAGSAHARGRAGVSLGGAALLLLLAIGAATGRWALPRPRHPRLWLALAVLIALPLLPWPPALLRWVSPRAAEIYTVALPGWPSGADVATGLPEFSPWRSATLSRWVALETISLGCVYAVVFLACATYGWSHRAATRLLATIVALAVVETAYAFAQQSMERPRLLWFACLEDTTCTGTYLNRNHFAGLVEMALPLVLAAAGWLSGGLRPEVGRAAGSAGVVGRVNLWLSDPARGRIVALLALATLLVVGLAISSSRSAFFCTLGALALMSPFLPRAGSATLEGQGARAYAVPLALAAAAVLWLSFPQVSRRMSFDDPTRVDLWMDAVDLIGAFPAVGVGPGSFASAYPLFRSRTVSLWGFPIEHAHNDYLEWIGEVGIPAGVVSLVLLFGLLVRAALLLRRRRLPLRDSWILWGATTAVIALLLHSFTDFNLHTPANAIVFFALLGFVARFAAFDVGHRPRLPSSKAAVAIGAAALCWGVGSLRLWNAEMEFRRVRPDAPLRDLAVASGGQSADELPMLVAAVERFPGAPEFQAAIGSTLLAPPIADAAAGRKALLKSLGAAPMQPDVLLGLATMTADAGNDPAALDLARRAADLSPHDPAMQLKIGSWLLARWEVLDAARREAARKQIQAALRLSAQAARLREDHRRVADALAAAAH